MFMTCLAQRCDVIVRIWMRRLDVNDTANGKTQRKPGWGLTWIWSWWRLHACYNLYEIYVLFYITTLLLILELLQVSEPP